MRWLLALLVVIILGGCNSHSGYNNNGINPFQAFADGYNQSRDRRYNRNSERLQRAQIQYYQNQNFNQYKQY